MCIAVSIKNFGTIAEAQSKPDIQKEKLEALFAVSLTYLENGIKAFKAVNDEANLALLYSNTGRLMRLMAHYYSEENCPLNKAAKAFYTKVSNYVVIFYYSNSLTYFMSFLWGTPKAGNCEPPHPTPA